MSNDDANASENGVRDKRGILTKDDRKFLLGKKELSEGGGYNRRRFIRERLYNALLDFRLLYEHMPSGDRNRVFDELRDPSGAGALAAVFGFIYLETHEPHLHAHFPKMLEYGVRNAKYRVLGDDAWWSAVSVNFNVDHSTILQINFAEIAEKIEEGRWNDVTDSEARAFLQMYAESDGFDLEAPMREHQRFLREEREQTENDDTTT
jgi:hypothetical protein